MNPVRATSQEPVTVITTVIAVVGAAKTILSFFSSKDDHYSEIADALQKLGAQNDAILTKLDTVSSAIEGIQLSVDTASQANRSAWHDWFSSQLAVPIVALATEMQRYQRLKSPSESDRLEHLKTVGVMYENFPAPIVEGKTFGNGNPVAMQLVFAVLAEEKGGELLDPSIPRKRDRSLVALRLQVLVNRIDMLSEMLDSTQAGSIGNLKESNESTVRLIGDDLAYIDSHYLDHDMPYQVLTRPTSRPFGNGSCTGTVTTRVFAYLTGNKDSGYLVTRHQQPDEMGPETCWRGPPTGHWQYSEHPTVQMQLPGVPPQGSLDGAGGVDWVSNVAQYNQASVRYRKAKAYLAELNPIAETLGSTKALLEQRLIAVQATCQRLGGLQCDGTIPQVHLVF